MTPQNLTHDRAARVLFSVRAAWECSSNRGPHRARAREAALPERQSPTEDASNHRGKAPGEASNRERGRPAKGAEPRGANSAAGRGRFPHTLAFAREERASAERQRDLTQNGLRMR